MSSLRNCCRAVSLGNSAAKVATTQLSPSVGGFGDFPSRRLISCKGDEAIETVIRRVLSSLGTKSVHVHLAVLQYLSLSIYPLFFWELGIIGFSIFAQSITEYGMETKSWDPYRLSEKHVQVVALIRLRYGDVK